MTRWWVLVIVVGIAAGGWWTAAGPVGADELSARGEAIFSQHFGPEQGLGPLYNERACVSCHSEPVPGGVGPNGLSVVLRVGRLTSDGFDPLIGRGGPVSRAHSVAELGSACTARAGIPPEANLTSVRNAPALFGLGLIDRVPDEVLLGLAANQPAGLRGRANLIADAAGRMRVGRFGWKADTATLEQFVADAFRNEHGLTNPLAPDDAPPIPVGAEAACGLGGGLDDDGSRVAAVTAFVASLGPLAPLAGEPDPPGAAVFGAIGCAGCHLPRLATEQGELPLYSDLLIHDLGGVLNDGVPQGQATGADWRTTPLWGLSRRPRLLHDGRAQSVRAAILAHGGEAEPSVQRYRALEPAARDSLLAFLAGL